MNRIYMCIDLKSFYASVECVERKLNPITTNLVVADLSRTQKTVCLAVTPSLKQYGLSGRSRLYEVYQKVNYINKIRRSKINNDFIGSSCDDVELSNNKNLKLDFIVAVPRMRYYMKYSTKIYNIYLKYIAPEDIVVYSIDEVFCDITNYLKLYKTTPEELVTKIIADVYKNTGITATAGIGTNMYLAKIAMDIVAKHMEPNEFGVRLASLDEMSYRHKLWNHKPLTDFWRVGKGIANRLKKYNINTMGDIARISLKNEDFLYKLFGVNAELLIDHAWGYEPCTMKDIRSYRPSNNSLSQSQVLHTPYKYESALLVLKEMVDLIVLDMVSKHFITNQIVLTIGYDIDNLNNKNINYDGEIVRDFYGRLVPKPAHGNIKLDKHTLSSRIITEEVVKLYNKIIDKNLLVRKITIAVMNLKSDKYLENERSFKQFDLFSNNEEVNKKKKIEKENEIKERKIEETLLNIKNKYGKNSILKAMNLEKDATARERNIEVGGHRG